MAREATNYIKYPIITIITLKAIASPKWTSGSECARDQTLSDLPCVDTVVV